VLNIKLKYW